MTPARDLLTALQSAPHGTPELSAKVVCALLAPEGAIVGGEGLSSDDMHWSIAVDGGWNNWPIPPEVRDCTTSIDAATALIRRVRPDGVITLHIGRKSASTGFGCGKPYALAADAPLSMCSALIASQIEEER